MKKYNNLSQCKGKLMCYFRSTDVEQKNYERLLWSVPDSMLYHLSQNEMITIIDKSTKPKGKIERIFVPVLNDVLNHLYFKEEPKHPDLKYHFDLALLTIRMSNLLKTKFMFWKQHIKQVKIYGMTIQVEKEWGLEK